MSEDIAPEELELVQLALTRRQLNLLDTLLQQNGICVAGPIPFEEPEPDHVCCDMHVDNSPVYFLGVPDSRLTMQEKLNGLITPSRTE